MIVISAAGSDGRSVLPGLQGASPAPGGPATSDPAPRTRLAPGHLVRHNGGWAVVAGIRHDGIHGITTADLIGADASPVEAAACQPVISTTVPGSAGPGATAPSGTAYVLDVASLAAALAALSLAAPGVSDAASAAALLRLLSRSKAHCRCCTDNECECGGTALAGGA